MSTEKYSNNHSVAITLTSRHDPLEKRYLVITSHTPSIIGRASSSQIDGRRPSPTNALFNSPVVSRRHAELTLSPWAPSADEITITDKSTHGTRVNGRRIQKDEPMSLRTGDTLQFGTTVSRGAELHDGVTVTFARSAQKNSESWRSFTQSLQPLSKGYHVPSDSDYESEEDVQSINSDDADEEEDNDGQEASSAKTTPEQVKSQPGSAARPIVVDNVQPPPRPNFIDLADEDDIDYYPSPAANENSRAPKSMNSITMVRDSLKDDEVFVPESFPRSRRSSGEYASTRTNAEKLADSQIFTATSPDPYLPESDGDDDEDLEANDDADAEECEHDYPDSEASELADPEVALSEDDEPLSYSLHKAVSPELESVSPSQRPESAEANVSQVRPDELLRPIKTAAFDPVRESQAMEVPDLFRASSSQTAQPPQAAKLTSAQLPQAAQFSSAQPPQATKFSSAPIYRSIPAQPAYLASGYDAMNSYYSPSAPFHCGCPDYECSFQPSYNAAASHPSPGYAQPQPHHVSSIVPSSSGKDWSKHNQSPKSRIAIPELLEKTTPQPSQELQKKQGDISRAPRTFTFASTYAEDVSQQASRAEAVAACTDSITGTKRKADEISKDSSTSLPASEADMAVLQTFVNTSLDALSERADGGQVAWLPARPNKYLKVRRQTSIGEQVGKYAAAAVLGSVGTVAFLCSPLAQKFIEWLD